MKKIHYILLASVIILSACKNNKNENQNEVLSVSILPQKYFIEQIANKDFEINILIPPGSNPVSYEPTANQLQSLSKSKLYFSIGHLEFEKNWLERFKSQNKDLKVINTSEGIELISFKCEHDHHDHSHGHDHHHSGIDPHIWTSPQAVKKQVQTVLEALTANYPDKKEEYTSNYHKFEQRLDSLDNYLKEIFSELENKKFIIFHPAMGYFAQNYGLEQVSIEFEGKEPTPAHMKKVIDIAKAEGIKIIFVQKQFSMDESKAIAEEINGQVIHIDPLAYDWYNNMVKMANEIKAALN